MSSGGSLPKPEDWRALLVDLDVTPKPGSRSFRNHNSLSLSESIVRDGCKIARAKEITIMRLTDISVGSGVG